jgi:hypothetical protein
MTTMPQKEWLEYEATMSGEQLSTSLYCVLRIAQEDPRVL